MSSSHRICPVLVMVEGDNPGRLFELNRHSITIGRNPAQCEVAINAREISRRHARIIRESGEYLIKDLGSRSGTIVNGERIEDVRMLRDGDEIRLWSFVFRFEDAKVRVSGDQEGHGSTILRVRDVFDEGDRSHVRGQDLRPKLGALVGISKGIFQSLDLQEVLEETISNLFEVFPWTSRGFILLRDEGSEELVPKAVRTGRGEHGNLTISQTIVRMVMDQKQAILSSDAIGDDQLKYAESIRLGRTRTLMSVPLVGRGPKPIGLIQLDTSTPGETYSKDDLDILVVVAGFVAVAVEHASLHAKFVRRVAFEAEEDHARRVQRLFLPKARPQLPGYEFWDCYYPAESLSGDYFGYMNFGGSGQLAVMIGDVSGKGMSAALIMAKLSAEARLAVSTETEPSRVVERLNAQIVQDELDGMFVTFLLAWIDPDRHQIRFVRAGHLGPLVRRANGRVEVIGEQEGGPPLGLVRNRVYEPSRVDLGPGDVLVLYTDGVSEALDPTGNLFGTSRVEGIVAATEGGAGAIGRTLMQAVRAHSGAKGQSDDITIICLGRLEGKAPHRGQGPGGIL